MDNQERDKRAEWRKEFRGYYQAVSGELPSKLAVTDAMECEYAAGVPPMNAAGMLLEDLGYEESEIDAKLTTYPEILTRGD